MTAVKDSPAIELADLVREYQADLWRYLRYLGCEASEADDLVQETFLALVRKPPELRCREAMPGYLRTTARNQLLMLRRHRGRELATADLELAENVWAEATGPQHSSHWLDALRDCLTTRRSNCSIVSGKVELKLLDNSTWLPTELKPSCAGQEVRLGPVLKESCENHERARTNSPG